MIADQTALTLTLAQRYWAAALEQVRGQMSLQTYDFCLRSSQVIDAGPGRLKIGIVNPLALDWLNNREKLRAGVQRELDNIAGCSLSLEFTAIPITLPPLAENGQTHHGEVAVGPSDAAQAVASANYYAGFFEGGGTGFSQIPHHSTFFWQNLLGPAFALWLILVARETRTLKSPANWWSKPVAHKYVDLARMLNKSHHRYVSGDEIECTKSRERRQAGGALARPGDCCQSAKYDLLRYKTHPRTGCGLICLHWKTGVLETLARWNLVVVELINGLDAYKFNIQTWRMLPVLTPFQVSRFEPALQDEYRGWIRSNGHHFNIPSLSFWEGITEENLVPFMPTHDQPEITHNFDGRRKKQDFLRHAVSNANYRTGLEDDDEISSMHG